MIHPFEKNTIASLTDLNTDIWYNIFTKLEKEQEIFLSKESVFRSKEYKWPRDPLHTWSRIWEYPYVYYNIKKEIETKNKLARLNAIDFGSGVTFFPFSLAKLGININCIDIDPVCGKDIEKAKKEFKDSAMNVSFQLLENSKISFQDKSVDIVYSISVLEHIESFENPIREIHRILKEDGLFILTYDLDLRGNQELSVKNYLKLNSILSTLFYNAYPEVTIHPADILKSDNSKYSIEPPFGLQYLIHLLRQGINLMTFKSIQPKIPFHLTVMGCTLRKKR